MSYTTNRQPQGILKDPETLLREGMIAETVAINDYSHFISLTENKDLKELFYHIMEDEKRHYGLFLNALRELDKEEEDLSEKAIEHVKISAKEKYKEFMNSKGSSKNNILVFIREAIKGELEAIVLYEDLISHLSNGSLISLIKEITKDEKEHVEELTRALILLDKDAYGPI